MSLIQGTKRRGPPRELKPSLADMVTQQVRADIVAGEWHPGERLLEVRLANIYGVSRVPVREALRRLEAEGFLSVLPNRGATVNSLTSKEALELLSVRASLERLAAREAATNRTEADLEELRWVVAAAKPMLATGDAEGLAALNTRFHQALFAASKNGTAGALVAPLWAKITWSYSVRVGPKRSRQSWAEHARLAQHIENGDADAAEIELIRHLDRAAQDSHLRFAARPIR